MMEWHVGLSSEDEAFAPQVQVQSVRGRESLGQIYELEVALAARDRRLDAQLLEIPLTLELSHARSGQLRKMHGIAASLRELLTDESDVRKYRVAFVPRLWRLSLTHTSEIFMGMDVGEILRAKLEQHGFVHGADFELRLMGGYPKREYVVQYDETDLQFVKRLAEHWGITLWFAQGEQREVAVFTDHADGFGDEAMCAFTPRSHAIGVHELTSTMRTLAAQQSVKDYNYRTPQVALLATAAVDGGQGGHRYAYGDHFKSADEASSMARIRAEEIGCERTVFEGRSSVVGLLPGTPLRIEGRAGVEPHLLITEIDHEFSQPVMLAGDAADHTYGYHNAFRAVPRATPYRPPRRTPKPRIHGSITAQIESSGGGQYAELDAEGRYHVRFLFDVGNAPRAQATRLVRMAQPHAGPGYGFHFPLRHGVEVLITHVDGDPDRPIISAAVPNPQTPSVVGEANGRRNIIRTGGGNEINLDDTEGAERIKLSTPCGSSSFQIGAPNAPSAGAALSTADSWNAVAGSAATTASSAVSIFSDVASIMASADIVAFAGATNIKDALAAKAPDLAKSVADGALAGLETASKFEQALVNDAQVAAQGERDEAERERSRKRQWQNANQPWMRPPASFDQKIAQHERAAAQHDTHAAALEAQRQSNEDARSGYKDAANKIKTGASLAKSGKDAWSAASKIASRAAGTAAAAAAGLAAASGSAFAAAGRIGGSVPEPGSPKNIQAAGNSAALIGFSNALVAGINAGCVGSAQAVLAGGGKALVKSPGQAEIAGMARCLMTSGALVDIKSYAVLKTEAGATASHKAGAAMSLQAGARLGMQAGAAATLRAGGSIGMRASGGIGQTAGGAITQKAAGTIKQKAGGAFNIKAGAAADIKAAGNVTVTGGPEAKVKASAVRLVGSGGKIDVGANVHFKGGTIFAKGKLDVTGSSVSLKASTIKASGRVLLG